MPGSQLLGRNALPEPDFFADDRRCRGVEKRPHLIQKLHFLRRKKQAHDSS